MTSDCSSDSVGGGDSCGWAETRVHIDSCTSSCRGDQGVSAINTSAVGERASSESPSSAHTESEEYLVELTVLCRDKSTPKVLWHRGSVALDSVVESQTSRQRSPGNLPPSTLFGMFKLVFETGHVRLEGPERPGA